MDVLLNFLIKIKVFFLVYTEFFRSMMIDDMLIFVNL